jgi:hypothetical protein
MVFWMWIGVMARLQHPHWWPGSCASARRWSGWCRENLCFFWRFSRLARPQVALSEKYWAITVITGTLLHGLRDVGGVASSGESYVHGNLDRTHSLFLFLISFSSGFFSVEWVVLPPATQLKARKAWPCQNSSLCFSLHLLKEGSVRLVEQQNLTILLFSKAVRWVGWIDCEAL